MKKLFCLFLALVCFLSVPAFAEDPDPAIVGKWSFYYDITKQPPEIQKVMDSSLIVYDLYLFEDSSAFMTNMNVSKKTEKPDFSYGALSGVWLGSADNFVVGIAGNSYRACIDGDYLLLYMTKSLPLAFVKVDCTDKMIELSN